MIKEEFFTIGSTNLVKHYSDSGFKIRQLETAFLYDEANDLVPCRYTYEETDIPITQEEVENGQSEEISE